MPELQVKANELVDTRVDFIALVKRGANRIPFRIVKQENEEMLDLQKIGRSLFKKAEAAPEVIAAVVPAGSDLEMLAKLFEDAGLDSTAFLKTEIDGVVTLAKADADKADDTVVIKSGDIGLVITGLKKGFDAWSVEGGFSDAVKAQAFYPSLFTAGEVLHETVFDSLRKSASPEEASQKITKSVDAFRSYVTGLAAALPASAFYVDRHYDSYMKADAEKTARAVDPDAAVESDEDAKALPFVAKKESEPTTKADEVIPEGDQKPTDRASEEVAKADATPADEAGNALAADVEGLKKSTADILAAMAELSKSITAAVTEVHYTVKSDLAALTTRVETVAEQATKTDAALSGTVFADAGEDKRGRVAKSADRVPPLLDTAYNRIEAA